MKKFFLSMLAAITLTAPAAQAQLEYKQVGTLKMGDYNFRTSNYPVYTMSKYGEGITIYPASFLSMNAGTLIKEITYFGYQGSTKTKDLKFTVYVGNTTETTVQPFVIPAPAEGGKDATVVDVSKLTKFCEVTLHGLEQMGSSSEAAEVLTFTSTDGFSYNGENLVIYIAMNEGTARTDAEQPYTTFFTANNGTAAKCIGAYRNSDYATDDYNGGYGINTKAWSYNESQSVRLPVIKLGYAGERVQIDATVKGRVVSSRNAAGINGATVTIGGQTVTTPASGQFEITVEDVDPTATYTLTASAAGFESASQTVDLRSGGTITLDNITLTKLPVPAVLSGTVVNKAGFAAIAGAEISYAGQTAVSAADGSYSISIANIDDLPEEGSALTASAEDFLPYSTIMSLNGDTDFDIQMEALPELEGEGTLFGKWSLDSYDYKAPFNPLWRNSESQVIYPAAMFDGVAAGTKFSSITFYGYYPEPSSGGTGGEGEGEGDDDYWSKPAREPQSRNFNIRLYMGATDKTAFNRNSTDHFVPNSLTAMYDGEVSVATGGDASHPVQLFTIELDQPFVYEGGNVAMAVEATGSLSGLFYFCQDKRFNDNVISRSGTGDISEDNYVITSTGVPVMRLGSFVPTAEISGKVTDIKTGAALEGVEVTLTGNGASLKTETDAQGNYSISLRDATLGATYVANYSLTAYYDETFDIVFTAENLAQVKDVQMECIYDGIESVITDGGAIDVYTVTGVRVLSNAAADDIKRLPKGIYICGGKKIVIK